ncbi:MAG: hypothetical protein HY814_14830 [Candidatus Riflebacteria bacterium]|nr:hypothetical protein [Candidatus Riflebacteria bacterium]
MSTELIRRGAGLSMIQSYLELGRFYLSHGRASRAKQILVFGLLHDPSNPLLLSETATAELRLGNLDEAHAYAAEALRLDPTPERSWTLTEIERLQAARAAQAQATSTSGAEASTAPAPPPEKPAAPAPAPAAIGLMAKVRALHLARALDGAVKAYNTGRKKADRMTKLEVQKLTAEHLLPDEFEMSSFPGTELTSSGAINVPDHGTVAELAPQVAEYESMAEQVSKLLHEGALAEAVYLLRDMHAKFPGEADVTARYLYTLRLRGQFAEALQVADGALSRGAKDPALAYERAVLLLDLGRTGEAASQAEAVATGAQGGVHSVLARELARLARDGLDRELEADVRKAAGAGPRAEPAGGAPPPSSPAPAPAAPGSPVSTTGGTP